MIEKVNPCHPDKVADRIAGAIVDLAYRTENDPKIAVEVLIGHGACYVIIETSAAIYDEQILGIVHRIAGKVDVVSNLRIKNCQIIRTMGFAVGITGFLRGCP